ncbi:MAG: SRPBCC family protein [Acidimicrobiia bacterium]|nr:SRPBCC family protein [Acidimicrobiia bacterium]
MAVYTETKLMEASIEDVYAYRLDFLNLADYNPDVRDVERTTQETGAGAEYRFRIRVLAIRPWATLRVREAVKPTRIEVDIESMFDANEVCEFDEVDDGTRVTFTTTVHTTFGPLSGLLDRLFVIPQGRRQTRRELDLIALNLAR